MDYGKLLGILGKYAGAAGAAGSVLGAQQAGKTQGKIAQAQVDQGHDRAVTDLYQTQQNAQNQAGQLDLERKDFANKNRATEAHQALIGALLGHGLTPTSISGGHASGGLLASLNANPDALLAMKTLGQQGSQAQNTPLQYQGGQMLKAPTLSAPTQVDNGGFLSTLANIAQIYGTASPLLKKPSNGYNTSTSGAD